MLDDQSIGALCSEFGHRVRTARQRKPLKPKELAALVGLSRSSIANLEAGRQRVPIHIIWKLSAALGLPVDQLVPDVQFLKKTSRRLVSGMLGQEPRLRTMSADSRAKVRDFLETTLSENPKLSGSEEE